MVAFGTALASFTYEIGWIRMLSLLLGSATHSFELMLSAFILGMALGAWLIRRRSDDGRESEIHVNYKHIVTAKEPDVELQRDDVVVVKESFF